MAGEARNPKVNVPLALVLSLVICLLILGALQIAFLGALSDKDLENGWTIYKIFPNIMGAIYHLVKPDENESITDYCGESAEFIPFDNEGKPSREIPEGYVILDKNHIYSKGVVYTKPYNNAHE